MLSLTDFTDDDLWCGVFQGGGARGVAYGGALEAVQAHGQWFKAVAGSSAGAITAALVAAGLEATDIRTVTATLLAAVRPRTRMGRVAERLGLQPLVHYDSNGLEASLDSLLHAALGRAVLEQSPVTFGELYQATGIRLYVIVTDASTGTPYPFCEETSPDLPVATAVAASCSIPVVFAPRYAVAGSDSAGGPSVRQLHDGGMWANFPSFVFSDQAFRAYFELDTAIGGKVLGFTLIYDAVLPTRIDRFVHVPRGLSSLAHQLAQPAADPAGPSSPASALDALARRAIIPFVCFLAAGMLLLLQPGQVETVLPAVVLAATGVVAVEAFSWRVFRALAPAAPLLLGCLFLVFAWRFLGRHHELTAVVPAVIIVMAAVCLIASALTLYSLIDRTATGLRGALRTLNGQAIRPAPWVDSLPDSHLIVVPTGDLTVLSFNASPPVIGQAVSEARDACHIQLTAVLTRKYNSVAHQVLDILAAQQQRGTHEKIGNVIDEFPDHRIRQRASRPLT